MGSLPYEGSSLLGGLPVADGRCQIISFPRRARGALLSAAWTTTTTTTRTTVIVGISLGLGRGDPSSSTTTTTTSTSTTTLLPKKAVAVILSRSRGPAPCGREDNPQMPTFLGSPPQPQVPLLAETVPTKLVKWFTPRAFTFSGPATAAAKTRITSAKPFARTATASGAQCAGYRSISEPLITRHCSNYDLLIRRSFCICIPPYQETSLLGGV